MSTPFNWTELEFKLKAGGQGRPSKMLRKAMSRETRKEMVFEMPPPRSHHERHKESSQGK